MSDTNKELDELELTEEELEKIKLETEKEYNELGGKNKSNLLVKLLALGILVVFVLILRTVYATKDVVRNVNEDKTVIEVNMDDNGKITSKQNISIGD